jgi:hypothetical protein
MTAVVVAVLLLAAAAAAGVPVVRWWSDRRLSARELPPLVLMGPLDDGWNPPPPRVDRRVRAREAVAKPVSAAASAAPVRLVSSEESSVEETGFRESLARPLDVELPLPVSSETIRFRRPVEEAVQLLPGRLEVLAGDPQHREIRFVKLPGEPMQLILGRDAGPSAQYVALRSGTVSRRHAKFAFTDGRWAIANLSKTNPVVVNDEELSHSEGPRPLVDGDRLELGEVVLRFRAH